MNRGKEANIFCRDPLDDVSLEMWEYVEKMMNDGAETFKRLKTQGVQFVFGTPGSRATEEIPM